MTKVFHLFLLIPKNRGFRKTPSMMLIIASSLFFSAMAQVSKVKYNQKMPSI